MERRFRRLMQVLLVCMLAMLLVPQPYSLAAQPNQTKPNQTKPIQSNPNQTNPIQSNPIQHDAD
ncbi:hypothetical protein [Herpetosiphon gulosus]|uniref:Uncharacterized protein n=1 Tax=Herpetosiphon gulosus TaxID=1973496 RepID=A0ABP9X4P7_9CHLR